MLIHVIMLKIIRIDVYSRNETKEEKRRNINHSCKKIFNEKHDGTAKIFPSELFF